MNLEMATNGMDASLEEGRGLEEAGGNAGGSEDDTWGLVY
jgi:hypothetical protein